MSQLFAERFKTARKMNGLSLEDLSKRLPKKISKQALHKYEKGDVIPDSEMISSLSEVFNVRPDYFTREMRVELGSINFRKLDNFPVKEKEKIVEKTRETISRYLELEEILGITTSFENPIAKELIDSCEKVESVAAKLRAEWGLGVGPIYNVVELLEEKNIKVIEFQELDGFDGMQTWVNSSIPVIVLNTGNLIQNDRKRFTALHELAHLLLEFPDDMEKKRKEELCHYFAGAMLFPKDAAAFKELGNHRNRFFFNELGALKQYYGISMQALIYRLKNLGIVSYAYHNQLLNTIKLLGWKVEEPFPFQGSETSNRFTQLIFRALGEELISMSKAASLSNQTLAEFKQTNLMVA